METPADGALGPNASSTRVNSDVASSTSASKPELKQRVVTLVSSAAKGYLDEVGHSKLIEGYHKLGKDYTELRNVAARYQDDNYKLNESLTGYKEHLRMMSKHAQSIQPHAQYQALLERCLQAERERDALKRQLELVNQTPRLRDRGHTIETAAQQSSSNVQKNVTNTQTVDPRTGLPVALMHNATAPAAPSQNALSQDAPLQNISAMPSTEMETEMASRRGAHRAQNSDHSLLENAQRNVNPTQQTIILPSHPVSHEDSRRPPSLSMSTSLKHGHTSTAPSGVPMTPNPSIASSISPTYPAGSQGTDINPPTSISAVSLSSNKRQKVTLNALKAPAGNSSSAKDGAKASKAKNKTKPNLNTMESRALQSPFIYPGSQISPLTVPAHEISMYTHYPYHRHPQFWYQPNPQTGSHAQSQGQQPQPQQQQQQQPSQFTQQRRAARQTISQPGNSELHGQSNPQSHPIQQSQLQAHTQRSLQTRSQPLLLLRPELLQSNTQLEVQSHPTQRSQSNNQSHVQPQPGQPGDQSIAQSENSQSQIQPRPRSHLRQQLEAQIQYRIQPQRPPLQNGSIPPHADTSTESMFERRSQELVSSVLPQHSHLVSGHQPYYASSSQQQHRSQHDPKSSLVRRRKTLTLQSDQQPASQQSSHANPKQGSETNNSPQIENTAHISQIEQPLMTTVVSKTANPGSHISESNSVDMSNEETTNEDADEELEENWNDLTDDDAPGLNGPKATSIDCVSLVFYDDDDDERHCKLCDMRFKETNDENRLSQTFSESTMRDLIEHAKSVHPVAWKQLRDGAASCSEDATA